MYSNHTQQILTIKNKRGLHARAAAKFVKCVEKFKAEIVVSKEENHVSGTSIMGLMMLSASIGTSIKILASGEQAKDALSALKDLVDNKFGEDKEDEHCRDTGN